MLYEVIIMVAVATLSSKTGDSLYSYFENNITQTGLVLDRESNREIVSIAATGFGMKAWGLRYQEGKLSREASILRVRKAFRATLKHNPTANQGWIGHFLSAEGTPYEWSEISTLDTAIFYMGARQAAKILGEQSLIHEVEEAISKVNVKWMMSGAYFKHGLYWKGDNPEFIPHLYDEYSEAIILYRLFDKPFVPKKIRYDMSLFVYYYPLCFLDEPELIEYLKRAIAHQQERYMIWGFTATNTQDRGYQNFDPHTVSPVAVMTLINYLSLSNDICFPAEPIQSRNILTGWTSSDRIGIDFGACYILYIK